MLVHWEAARAAIRAELDEHLLTAGASPEQKDELANALTNTAIETYTRSIFKDFKPGTPQAEIFTGGYSRP